MKKISVSMFLILFICALGACKKETPPPPNPPISVQVAVPTLQRLIEWDEYTGRFQARETVDIRARVSGYLDQINFRDGQMVRKDDVLFVIDPRPFQIALDRAQSVFDNADKDYARSQKLRETNAISQEDLDTSFQAYRQSKSDLDDAQLNLTFTQVKSPITGRAGRRLVDVGNVVSGTDTSGTSLTTVVSVDPIDFYFEISEQDVLKYIRLDAKHARSNVAFLKIGDEKDFMHEGEVTFMDNQVNKSTGTRLVRAMFSNKNEHFLPGVFGTIRIPGSAEYEAMLIPDAAIGINQTQNFVYVVGEGDIVQPRPIVKGPLHEGGMRIVREGLKPTDRVVVNGLTLLRPGVKVDSQNGSTHK